MVNCENSLHERKHPRLTEFDYCSPGAYFVTICTEKRRCLLSRVVRKELPHEYNAEKSTMRQSNKCDGFSCSSGENIDRNLSPYPTDYKTEYTEYGKIAEEQLLLLEERYSNLKVDKYVIMPNHIHVIFVLCDKPVNNAAAGVNPRPTEETAKHQRVSLMDIVCAYKSLTTRACKRIRSIDKLFQTSFYDHIIRSKDDYSEVSDYIFNNPMRWQFDELFSKE